MISLEEAQKTGFRESTLEELRAYYAEIGKKAPGAAKSEYLARGLRADLGIPENTFEPHKTRPVKVKGGIYPPYNLDLDGKWEGRRHRIKVRKPADSVEKETGLYIHANGTFGCGHLGYPIQFGEVQCVPEPVYLRLNEIEATSFREVKTGGTEDAPDIVTEFNTTEKKYLVDYLGVDKDTADRAGSLQEWYKDQGLAWFNALKPRELRAVADRLEVSRQIKNSHTGAVSEASDSEVLARVMTFLYGDPEVEEAA